MSNTTHGADLPAELAPYRMRTVKDANGPRHFLRNGNRAATVDILGPMWFVVLSVMQDGQRVVKDQRTLRSEPRMVAWVSEWLESGR